MSFIFQGLIFVVDSNDRERMAEAKDELQKMVNCSFLKNFIRFNSYFVHLRFHQEMNASFDRFIAWLIASATIAFFSVLS